MAFEVDEEDRDPVPYYFVSKLEEEYLPPGAQARVLEETFYHEFYLIKVSDTFPRSD